VGGKSVSEVVMGIVMGRQIGLQQGVYGTVGRGCGRGERVERCESRIGGITWESSQ
jgi:hypothetical protein